MKTGIKNLVLVMALIGTIIQVAHSGEFTGAGKVVREILERNNYNIAELERSGHELLMGEFTGGGKSLALNRVKIVVTPDEVIRDSEIDAISLKLEDNTPMPLLQSFHVLPASIHYKSLEYIESSGRKIPKTSIKAVIYK